MKVVQFSENQKVAFGRWPVTILEISIQLHEVGKGRPLGICRRFYSTTPSIVSHVNWA